MKARKNGKRRNATETSAAELAIVPLMDSIQHGIPFEEYWAEVQRRLEGVPIETIRGYLRQVLPLLDLGDDRNCLYLEMLKRYGDEELKKQYLGFFFPASPTCRVCGANAQRDQGDYGFIYTRSELTRGEKPTTEPMCVECFFASGRSMEPGMWLGVSKGTSAE